MVFGEERIFESDHPWMNPKGNIILRFVGSDSFGLKMKGKLPPLWNMVKKEVLGPLIYDDETVYKIVKIDYGKNITWIKPASSDFSTKKGAPRWVHPPIPMR